MQRQCRFSRIRKEYDTSIIVNVIVNEDFFLRLYPGKIKVRLAEIETERRGSVRVDILR